MAWRGKYKNATDEKSVSKENIGNRKDKGRIRTFLREKFSHAKIYTTQNLYEEFEIIGESHIKILPFFV